MGESDAESDSLTEQILLKFCESEDKTMGDYIGKHEQGAESLFDAMVADLFRDKEIRTEKFLRTHYVRNDGKPQKKDKRKANFSRKKSYFDRDIDDRRPNYGKAMDGTIRRYRADMDTIIAMADFEIELEDHENAIALYNDFVGMAMFSEHMAEIDMGLEQEKFPVKNMVEGDLRDARECRKMAQEILKGECY